MPKPTLRQNLEEFKRTFCTLSRTIYTDAIGATSCHSLRMIWLNDFWNLISDRYRVISWSRELRQGSLFNEESMYKFQLKHHFPSWWRASCWSAESDHLTNFAWIRVRTEVFRNFLCSNLPIPNTFNEPLHEPKTKIGEFVKISRRLLASC